MTAPIRPLTPAQLDVAECVAKGWKYKRIAEWLGVTPGTVRVHVVAIAALLPNPDRLSAYRCVMLWAARQTWAPKGGKAA